MTILFLIDNHFLLGTRAGVPNLCEIPPPLS